jgi:hypothetical protein
MIPAMFFTLHLSVQCPPPLHDTAELQQPLTHQAHCRTRTQRKDAKGGRRDRDWLQRTQAWRPGGTRGRSASFLARLPP